MVLCSCECLNCCKGKSCKPVRNCCHSLKKLFCCEFSCCCGGKGCFGRKNCGDIMCGCCCCCCCCDSEENTGDVWKEPKQAPMDQEEDTKVQDLHQMETIVDNALKMRLEEERILAEERERQRLKEQQALQAKTLKEQQEAYMMEIAEMKRSYEEQEKAIEREKKKLQKEVEIRNNAMEAQEQELQRKKYLIEAAHEERKDLLDALKQESADMQSEIQRSNDQVIELESRMMSLQEEAVALRVQTNKELQAAREGIAYLDERISAERRQLARIQNQNILNRLSLFCEPQRAKKADSPPVVTPPLPMLT